MIAPNLVVIHPGSEIGFGASIGPVFLNEERQVISFRVGAKHLNINGSCHGGAIATLADSQIAAVRRAAETTDSHIPTISLAIDYVAPVPLGAIVEMQVDLLRHTRSLIFTQAVMTVEGKVVARSNAIYRRYSARKGNSASE